MKTIAQIIHQTIFPLQFLDSSNHIIYHETSDGLWHKREYNQNGDLIFWGNYNGYWFTAGYNEDGEEIAYESSDGYKWDIQMDSDF